MQFVDKATLEKASCISRKEMKRQMYQRAKVSFLHWLFSSKTLLMLICVMMQGTVWLWLWNRQACSYSICCPSRVLVFWYRRSHRFLALDWNRHQPLPNYWSSPQSEGPRHAKHQQQYPLSISPMAKNLVELSLPWSVALAWNGKTNEN